MAVRRDVGVKVLGVTLDRWHPDYLADASSYTELGPRPGTPVTSATLPRLTPQIVGAQSQDLVLDVLQGGVPTLGGRGLQVGYRLAGEDIEDVRGYQPPLFVSDCKGQSINTNSDAALCPLSGKVVYRRGINISVWDPVTDVVSAGSSALATITTQTALAVVPGTDRVLALFPDKAYFSDDYATTWTTYSTDGPDSATNINSRTRAAFDGAGNLVYLTDDNSNEIFQFASSDQGATWSDVGSASLAALGTSYDMVEHPSGAVFVLWIDTTGQVVSCTRLGGAYESLIAQDAVEVYDAGAATTAAVSLGCDANGVLWAYITDDATTPARVVIRFSLDDGQTWQAGGNLCTTLDEQPRQMRLCPHPYGGLLAVAAYSSGGAVLNGALLQLGGWTGPGRDDNAWATSSGTTTDVQWHSWGDPTDSGYTLSGAATVGIGTPAGGKGRAWRIQTDGTTSATYSATVSTADSTEAAAEGVVQVATGGTATDIFVGLTIRHAANNKQYSYRLCFDSDGYTIQDMLTLGVGTKVLLDMTVRRHFRFTLDAAGLGLLQTQVRGDGETKWTVTTWLFNPASSGAATALSGAIVSWGAGSGDASDSYWWRVDGRCRAGAALQGYDNVGRGAGLYGVPIPDGYDTAHSRMCRLLLSGGPAFARESYEVPAAHDYPIEAAFPTFDPDSDRRWESVAAGVTQTILCDIDEDLDTWPLGAPSIALAVRNCNVRRIEIIARAASGTISTLGTMDLATGFTTVSYIRSGNVITPGASFSGRFIGAGELRGGQFRVGSNIAEIIDNTGGFFSNDTGVPCTLTLRESPSGAVTRMPASGADGMIVWPHGLFYAHLSINTARRQAWGFRIQSTEVIPPTHTGYRLGAAHLFGLRAMGRGFDHGSDMTYSPNVESVTDRRGTDRRKRLGPGRWSLNLNWDHGSDARRFRSGSMTQAPGYLSPVNGRPLAVEEDIVQQLIGFYRAAKDGELPVCAILKDAAAAASGTSSATLTDPLTYMVGTIDSKLSATVTLGQPGVDEFWRPGQLRITELL